MTLFGNRWEQVGERLGEGGAGEVYLVVDRETDSGKRFALKRLKNKDRLDRFRKEVTALETLNHPNILQMVYSGLDDPKRPFFVTEYCERGNLRALDLRNTDPKELLELFLGICEGVRELHRERGVHRDLKPENVLLRKDGTPVVADFGIVYLFDDDDGRITDTFEQVGSRYFICPENEEGRVPPSYLCDIYSLGKLLYWMMSGGRRIARASHRDIERDIVNIRNNYYLEHVNNVLDRMLNKKPGDRFETLTKVIGAVREAMYLMEGQYHPLTRKDQLCSYCGKGAYAAVSHGELQYLGVSGALATPSARQRILRCTHCGHLEYFFIRADDGAGDWLKAVGLSS